jgi:hypothetical protein
MAPVAALARETGIVMRPVQANVSQWDKLTGRDRRVRFTNISTFRSGRLRIERQAQRRHLAGDGCHPVPRSRTRLASTDRQWRPPWIRDHRRIARRTCRRQSRPLLELALLDHRGEVRATFDKFHLVPLGEYVPARRLLPFVDKLTGGAGNFSAGTGPATVRLPGLPSFSPLICYEVIFPGAVLDPGDRPAWLLNLTNDGWFGRSSGPYQHFASARFRSIEEGLPLIRSANSGISGVIDPLGRIVARTELERRRSSTLPCRRHCRRRSS